MKKSFLLGIGIGLTLLSIAAVKYFTDYPNIASPPDNFAIPLDTQQHAVGQTPYNFWTISQQRVFWQAIFVGNNSSSGTNETFWGVTPFQEVDAQFFYPTNMFFSTNWPPPVAPTLYGEVWEGNSNGAIYHVNSKVNALAWTKTNLISAP